MVRRSASKSTWASRADAVVLASLFLCCIVSAQTPKPASADTEKRVAQVYLGDSHASVTHPAKELKGFAKVNLRPGEAEQVTVALDRRAFSFYDVGKRDWSVEPGAFSILVGSSSAVTKLQGE